MKLSIKGIATGLAVVVSVGVTNSTLSADAGIDVSQIITKTDAESILGEKVNDPTPRNAEGDDGYYSKCNYYGVSRQKSLVLRVYQPGSGAMDPQKELELVAASATGPLKPVDGLGDKAQMFSGAGDSGAASGMMMLYIAKGNALVTIGLGGINDESAALAKAKEVAKKILAKL
jgi:hypothetical protein